MDRSYRMIKYFLGILPFFLLSQQEPQYSLFQFNPTIVNPAYAGFKEMGSINLAYRNQWIGFDGAPKTLLFSAHYPFLNQKVGAGINFMNDRAGARNYNNIMLNLCYNLRLSKNLNLGVGVAPNYQLFQFNYSKLDFKNPENSLMSLNNINESQFNLNLGFLLKSKTFFLGAGFTNINSKNVFETTLDTTLGFQNSVTLSYRMRTISYYTLGKSFMISENFIFSPALLIRNIYVNSLANVDLNLNFFLQKTIWLGIIFRYPFGPGFLVQYYVNPRFKIGYAFDTGLTQKVRLNSHEICISFDLYKNKSQIVSPRFF